MDIMVFDEVIFKSLLIKDVNEWNINQYALVVVNRLNDILTVSSTFDDTTP
jgi:hypothetical protein